MRLVFIHVATLIAASFALALPVHSQQNAQAPANSPTTTDKPKVIVDQSLSGGVYRSGAGHFTLKVPEAWRTNDDIVEPKFGIGGLSSPDNEIQLEIQQMPTTDSPAIFARKIDAKGDKLFLGYRKLSEEERDLAGRHCQILTFEWAQVRQGAGAPFEMKLVSRFFLMANDGFSVFALNFVTPEVLFDNEAAVFEQIVKSFHSTAKEDFALEAQVIANLDELSIGCVAESARNLFFMGLSILLQVCQKEIPA
jgi:hypothetical protein